MSNKSEIYALCLKITVAIDKCNYKQINSVMQSTTIIWYKLSISIQRMV